MSSSDSDKLANADTDEAFLSRWSRRKQAARETDLTDDKPAEEIEPTADKEVKQLTDADMPPLASLTEDSDYTGFLSPRVSEALRRKALRKLFHTPGFNIRDGLDDYDEEYTHFEKLGDIVTADMRFQMELEEQRRRERLAEAEAQEENNKQEQIQGRDQEQSAEQDETQLASDDPAPAIEAVPAIENDNGEVES